MPKIAKPQKRGNHWRIRYIDANGERQSETFATFDLARSALRRLAAKADEDRERRARLGDGGALSVSQAGARFLESLRPEIGDTDRRFKKRKRDHETSFNTHIKPHIGDTLLGDLTPAVMRAFVAKLAETKTGRPGEKNVDGKTLSPSRIRAVLVTLRQIAIAHDVAIAFEIPSRLRQKHRRARPKALQSVQDVRALLDACRDPWFKVAAAIACYCGARLGEVASLRWRHIEWQAETVTLALSWEGPLKHREEDGEADEGMARIVPLDPELAAILKAWREATDGKADDRVVLVHGERPLKEGYDDVAAKTRSACKRAGLPEVVFHELRHSYATIAASNGLPLAQLQALLGHANIATTGIYVNPDSARAALDPRARLSGPGVDQGRKSASAVAN